ncbi:unnamed protein product [Trichogramma brassicae]|uniref:Uncharacterized protein n=1 Tax=Trichogramma brassicae TaxID=86971 RepID=A0A6H5I154_9HYME|nr:unnamed protein product [Trichogramma brassicae]
MRPPRTSCETNEEKPAGSETLSPVEAPADGRLTSDCEIDATALGPARTSSSTSSLKTRISCNRCASHYLSTPGPLTTQRHRLRCASVSVRRHLHRRSVRRLQVVHRRICHPTHRDTRPRIGTCHAVHHHQVVHRHLPPDPPGHAAAHRHLPRGAPSTLPRAAIASSQPRGAAILRAFCRARRLHRAVRFRCRRTGAAGITERAVPSSGPTPLYRSVQRAARAVPTSALPPYASSFVSTPIDGATLRSSRRQQQQQTSSRMIALSMAPHIILRVVSSSSRHLCGVAQLK